jgi:PKD repeat protein
MMQRQPRPVPFGARAFLTAVVAGAALFLQACGGKAGTHAALKPPPAAPSQPAAPATPGQPAAPAGGTAALPALGELAAVKAGSVADTDRFRRGSEFKFDAPHKNIHTAGALLAFQPQWGAASSGAGDMALAVFEFPLSGVSGASSLTVSWGIAPKDYAQSFIALSDYSTGRWDWLQGQAAPYALDDITKYEAPDGRVFVAVGLVGTQSASLSWLRIGDNLPPTASLTAQPDTGHIPFTPSLNANASSDPEGAIASYDWDFDNDGVYEVTGSAGIQQHTFTVAGDYTVGVRVTDAGGLQATATTVVHAEPPAGPPVAKLDADWVFHDAPFTANLDASGSTAVEGTITQYEWDLDNDGTYELNTGSTPTASLDLTSPGQQTVGLRVTDSRNLTATTQLVLTGDGPGYDEVEDNDSPATANALPVGNIQGFEGNLGEGGYDGDFHDWFGLTIPAPGSYQFDLEFNAADADLDLELCDPIGLKIAASNGLSGDEHIVYTFGASGQYYLHALRFWTVVSQADYTLKAQRIVSPTVTLTADQTEGTVPLTAHFTADATTNAGAILDYQWDFDGDGIYDFDSGTTPTASYTYLSGRTFNTTVRVSASNGSAATGFVPVKASITYDETGGDAGPATAQTLPNGGVVNFAGNLGLGGPVSGTESDWYALHVDGGQKYGILLRSNAHAGDFDLALYGTNGTTLLDASTGTDDDEYLDYTFPATGTYFVNCYVKDTAVDRGPADYLLSVIPVVLAETGGDTSPGTANLLPAAPFSGFYGNLGIGGAVDGTESDWYALPVAQAGMVTLNLHFDAAQADLDLRLFAPDGTTQLAQSVGTDSDERIMYNFPSAGTYYVNCYVYSGAQHRGPANYELDAE